MKTILKRKGVIGLLNNIFLLIMIGFIFTQCLEPIELPKEQSDLLMTEYIYNNPAEFSEFGNIIKVTGVEDLLLLRGPYTLFLPNDSAMHAYYAKNGRSSYTDFDVETLKELVFNHLLKGEIKAEKMGVGALEYQNALNDYVACDLQGVDIILNKQAKITKRNIDVSNGTIHHINSVLDLVTKNVYELLSEDGGYTIFKAGLDECGLSDILKLVTIPNDPNLRKFYNTVLAVPDTLYQREGINNINDLVAKYDTDGDHKSDFNGFNQYMENHCLSGIHYFTELNNSKTLFYTVKKNGYIQIIDEDLKFKIDKLSDGTFTEFYYAQSNVPAKNGCIHTVNSQLPVNETNPIKVIYQVTQDFEMQQGSYYQKYSKRFYDGHSDFKNIKWDAEYLMYYFDNNSELNDNDGLELSTGYFWVVITTPRIRKGTYNLFSSYYSVDNIKVYVDGQFMAEVPFEYGILPFFGKVTFDETKKHKIMLESANSTGFKWDYVKFDPL